MDEIGRSLSKTQDAFDTTQKRLKTGRGNLVKRVEEIKTLGAKTKKTIATEILHDSERVGEENVEPGQGREHSESTEGRNYIEPIEELSSPESEGA